MNNSDEVPTLNPWPFAISDAVLIAAAYFIGSQARAPFSSTVVLTIGVLIFLGAILAVTPFVVNATRRQEAALLERQREIAALAQTTSASAEQLSIAAAGIQQISETLARATKHADQLPQKLQEKIHEFKAQLNEVAANENEALTQEVNSLRAAETERLETAIAAVKKLTADFAHLESATRKNVTEVKEALARFSQALSAPSSSSPTVSAPAAPSPIPAAETVEIPRTVETPVADHTEPAAVATAVATAVAAPAAATSTEVRPKKNGRKPHVEHSLPLEFEKSDEFSQIAPEETQISAISADGLTRLLVTAYIGIGNKLFLRGEGGGLSWDHGVPLQFVSIGKWRWESADADAPIRARLFKNDEQECTELGEFTIDPGHQKEVAAKF